MLGVGIVLLFLRTQSERRIEKPGMPRDSFVRSLFLGCIALLSAGLIGCGIAPFPEVPVPYAVVRYFRVLDAVTGDPVAGAQIGFASVEHRLDRSPEQYVEESGGLKVTDEDGMFQFCMPGRYFFVTTAPYYPAFPYERLPPDAWIFIVEHGDRRDVLIQEPGSGEIGERECSERVSTFCYVPAMGGVFRIQRGGLPGHALSVADCPPETENLIIYAGSR